MRKILAKYKNGNYRVLLFDDGTKIKESSEGFFVADFPDSIDLKITDYCENDCPMCHEKSSTVGRHGDLTAPLIDTFPSGMEVAIGGGNPLSHPDLLPFLERLKKQGLIANLTVNAIDLKKQTPILDTLLSSRLIYGLGVSCLKYDAFAVEYALSNPNVVLHLINGVFPIEDFKRLFGMPLKILILGYKVFGKGIAYDSPALRKRMEETKKMMPEIIKGFKVLSFDNLALSQLDIREIIGEKRYDEIYMGDDGEASMYVDLVKKQYAISSASEDRYPIKNTLRECFQTLPR